MTDPDPGQAAPVIEWGGSSADTTGVRKHATSTRLILNIAGKRLRASRTARVTLLGEYTFIGRLHGARCKIPAHMIAPRHLVAAHPDGTWFLSVRKGEHLRLVGFRRNLARGY